jgi:hypothetical protein
MLQGVRHKVLLLRCGVPTPGLRANERPIPSVRPHMPLDVSPCCAFVVAALHLRARIRDNRRAVPSVSGSV